MSLDDYENSQGSLTTIIDRLIDQQARMLGGATVNDTNLLLEEMSSMGEDKMDDNPAAQYRTTKSFLAPGPRGRYKINGILAESGMGRVYEAEDLVCRRKVALKVIHKNRRVENAHIYRFIVEALITAQLEHPNIVPVYDIGLDDDGNLFYTMKLLQGENLGEILTAIKEPCQDVVDKYPLSALLAIYLKTCEAVAYAHSERVIHRDLKPENIMIGDFGNVVLLDWGLGKALSKERGSSIYISIEGEETSGREQPLPFGVVEDSTKKSVKTVEGQPLGTPNFMPPEQALGKVDEMDERSDIYMLGGILYNILCLQPPLAATSVTNAYLKIARGDIASPLVHNEGTSLPHCPGGELPEALAEIAMKALSLDPKDRYQSVAELEADIQKYLTSGPATNVEQSTAPSEVKRSTDGHPFRWAIASFAVGVMFALLFQTLAVKDRHKGQPRIAANTIPAKQTPAKKTESPVKIQHSDERPLTGTPTKPVRTQDPPAPNTQAPDPTTADSETKESSPLNATKKSTPEKPKATIPTPTIATDTTKITTSATVNTNTDKQVEVAAVDTEKQLPARKKFIEVIEAKIPPDNIEAVAALVVDTFGTESKNLLGQSANVYQRAPSSAAIVVVSETIDNQPVTVLKLSYDKKFQGGPHQKGGWCGYYSILKNKETGSYLDASDYEFVTFQIRGENGNENFVIGLADDTWESRGDSLKSQPVSTYLDNSAIGKEWRQIKIPLADFALDHTRLASISICFESQYLDDANSAGTIYIDRIAFE